MQVCVLLSHQQRVVDRSLAARALRPRREANAATHTTQRRSRSEHLLHQLNCLKRCRSGFGEHTRLELVWHVGFGEYLITGPFHRCAISSLAVYGLNTQPRRHTPTITTATPTARCEL